MIEIITNLEGYLVEMKQQMTALYVDYTNRANEWENKEKVKNILHLHIYFYYNCNNNDNDNCNNNCN